MQVLDRMCTEGAHSKQDVGRRPPSKPEETLSTDRTWGKRRNTRDEYEDHHGQGYKDEPSQAFRNMRNGTIAALLVIAILAGAGAGYFIGVNGALNTSSFNNTFTTYFHYPISINYSGSWNLVYWEENGSTTPNNNDTIPGTLAHYTFKGNLNGAGNYESTITTYGVGYVENTFCANATELDSQSLALTLTVLGRTNSTTTSNPSTRVCVVYAV
jgi:hypothetical protein